MTLLEKEIEQKLLKDIEYLIDPLIEPEIPITLIDRPHFIKLFSKLSLYLLPTLAKEITLNPRFKINIQTIKLDYYKRNLALLEILLEKQNLPNNLRLVFKIVRENLSLKNISPYIDIYNLYHTYRYKNIIRHPTKEFLLYEPEEYYQIYKLISTLNLE